MRAEASVGEREQRNGELFRGAVVVVGLEVQREAQGGARGVVLAAEARAQAVRLDETLRDLERGVGRAEERIELDRHGHSPTVLHKGYSERAKASRKTQTKQKADHACRCAHSNPSSFEGNQGRNAL